MRSLASIRVIDAINPIPNADAIEAATFGGWNVVVKKGDFKVGDKVVYFEIDSWIPEHLAPFLANGGSVAKEYEGVMGFRLKTKKLRGFVSQGLVLPLVDCGLSDLAVDTDVTDTLNVKKYEKPISNSGGTNAGQARGNFPSFIPKTDQERCQNLKRSIADYYEKGLDFEASEKIDGTSITIYWNDDAFVPAEKPTLWDRIKTWFGVPMRPLKKGRPSYGVCSRNLDLADTEGNSYWTVARPVIEILRKLPGARNIAIQGEMAGEGIQGNQYKLVGKQLFVFDIYDIDNRRYFTPTERVQFCKDHNIQHVPIIDPAFKLPSDIAELLTIADAPSIVNLPTNTSIREGLVFKCNSDPSISFKAISNKWLLKYDA